MIVFAAKSFLSYRSDAESDSPLSRIASARTGNGSLLEDMEEGSDLFRYVKASWVITLISCAEKNMSCEISECIGAKQSRISLRALPTLAMRV